MQSGRSFSVVILQHAAQALAALNGSGLLANLGAGLQNLVVQPLMRSLAVIMNQETLHGVPQSRLTEKDHALKGFRLQGSEKSLEVRITIGTLWWQQHQVQIGCFRFFRILRT